MSRDDQAVALGWLMIMLALVLATTPWWRASLAIGPSGVFLAGVEPLWVNLKGGFAAALGWTKESDNV